MARNKLFNRLGWESVALSLLALALLFPQLAAARTLALLVGVSGYPTLAVHRQLQGPRNDVQLMRQTLVDLGTPRQAITVLADGVAGAQGLPTRANILSNFDKLAQLADAGDWVVLYLSGHGSQQPQLQVLNGHREPDGLDEIFLPYDVARWDGKTGAVENAIADDEIGAAIDKIKKKGALVWAIFDTCHAGDMVRSLRKGDDLPTLRYVKPVELGIPHEAIRPAQLATRSWGNTLDRVERKKRQAGESMIAFYASQPDEPAAEETFPAFQNRTEKKRYGLFTYYLAEELQNWQDKTFKTLAEKIGSRYRQDKRAFPTPLFTGGLDLTPKF